jgi:hypothetical protein
MFSISIYPAPSGSWTYLSWPDQTEVKVIWCLVRVPVLSEQILLAPPMISQDESLLTKF